MTDIQKKLFSLQDISYKEFTCKLIPNIEPNTVIGVRMPELRKLSKQIKEYNFNLSDLPHKYYEENNLHGLIICNIKDYDKLIAELSKFLDYVDNWATCDLLNPKLFKKHPENLINQVKVWLNSVKTYHIRFAIGVLLRYYLDDMFKTEYLDLVCNIKNEEYYVKMMVAWYFAEALTKQYDFAIKYITEQKLDKFIHQKAIQKAIDSHRISNEQKIFLKTLRTKKLQG